jgi:hypothetical protein
MPTYAQWLKKWKMGSSLAHQTSKKNCLISAYAGTPCTMCVKGRVGQVWACPDASGRLYDCGNTGQNTDFLEIEYPKNRLFKSDKSGTAPPGDWYTRGQVRSGAACCKHAWHYQVYISSHGTHLYVNHAFLVCTKFTHCLHPCSWAHMQGLPEPETTLTTACDTRATQSSMSVDGFI